MACLCLMHSLHGAQPASGLNWGQRCYCTRHLLTAGLSFLNLAWPYNFLAFVDLSLNGI